MEFLVPLSTTAATLGLVLYESERILLVQDSVGLYNGKARQADHDHGQLHLTTHRLIYLDAALPLQHSRYLPLELVRQSEYWIGIYFKSNPKIILTLGNPPARDSASTPGATTGASWVCRVCAMSNSVGGGLKCGLCGVLHDPSSVSSLPSRFSTPNRSTTSLPSLSTTPDPATPPKKGIGIACPSCTFLNHPSMFSCEVCLTNLVASAAPSLQSSLSTSSLPMASSNSNSTSAAGLPFVRISFRKGGEKACYAALKLALVAKEWELSPPPARPTTSLGKAGGGINAIIQSIDQEAKGRDDSIEDALKDLDALMAKAKEMIHLAQSMNEKLSVQEATATTSSATTSEQDTTLIRSSLLSLGLPTPAVTSDMIKEEKAYHLELARELAGVLGNFMGSRTSKGGRGRLGKEKRGIIGLDEVWCIWNRARGVALISPKDCNLALPYLPLYTSPPISLVQLPSGLKVVCTAEFSVAAFALRVLDELDLRHAVYASSLTQQPHFDETKDREERTRDGLTSLEISRLECIPFGFALEMIELSEKAGKLVRDEQGVEGVRWFRNYFLLL